MTPSLFNSVVRHKSGHIAKSITSATIMKGHVNTQYLASAVPFAYSFKDVDEVAIGIVMQERTRMEGHKSGVPEKYEQSRKMDRIERSILDAMGAGLTTREDIASYLACSTRTVREGIVRLNLMNIVGYTGSQCWLLPQE